MQVRIHGRGGQGAVTAAELLALAAFDDGLWAQAFPTFGSERMGAPVTAFCRIDDREIRTREPVTEPDVLIVMDPTLIHQVDLFAGLAPDGYVLLNTAKDPEGLGLGPLRSRLPAGHLVTVAATEMARRHLGRPVPNAALLGGFAALTSTVTMTSVVGAIRQRFPAAVADGNVAAAADAFSVVATAISPERTGGSLMLRPPHGTALARTHETPVLRDR